MSLSIVRTRLDKLIANTSPRVMLMTGGWGGGKTYQWNQALHRKSSNATLGRYAYVSLFGINSLGDLRRRVAEESVLELPLPDADPGTTLGDFSGSMTWRSRPWKLVKMLPVVPYLNKLEGLAGELSFMAVKDSVVCFDDVERRGSGLSLRDFFGLVTYLKEERNCRVLMIANDQRLDEPSKEELAVLLEKVVDEYIIFKPSHEEAADIGLAGLDHGLAVALRHHVLNLQTSNIRAIKKIAEFAVELKAVLSETDQDVLYEALKSLSLFGAGHWLRSDAFPPIEYALNASGSWSRYFRRAGEELTEQERTEEAWDQVISRMGYYSTSDLDKEIAASVARGFIVKDDLLPFAQQDARAIDAEKRRRSFSQEWGKFFRSVQEDSEAMLQRLYEVTLSNLDVISQGDAELAWQTFRDAKQDGHSDEILERFVAVNAETRPGVFGPTHMAPARGTDPAFRARMQKECSSRTSTDTLMEVLDRIQVNSGYASEDVNRIAASDFRELEKILRESDSEVFRPRILALIKLRELNATEDPEAAARTSDNAIQFLRDLIAADPLMQIRVGHYLPAEPVDTEG